MQVKLIVAATPPPITAAGISWSTLARRNMAHSEPKETKANQTEKTNQPTKQKKPLENTGALNE